MSRQSPFKNQHRQAHIARAQATQWRTADERELSAFLEMANNYFQFDCELGDVMFESRKREVSLETGKWDYRIILVPGATPWAPPFPAITAGDVEKFERRQAP